MATIDWMAADTNDKDNATAPGFLIGDEVGGDHGLAVPWADGMENAVDKGDPEQLPHRGPILTCPDERGQRTVEGGLLGEDPTDQA